ncbi:MAG: hypothetical protein FJX77_14780, partial [Armatimonadetes bacterium]|nr:hypothetical protein [Armatimonadota bacterium]
MVTTDFLRILGYAPGRLPPLPTQEHARRAKAADLAARYHLLDEAERERLPALAPHAFQPLLARYVRWAQEDAKRSGREDRQGLRLFSLLEDMEPVLRDTCGKPDTAALVRGLSELPGSSHWRAPLERILKSKGDPGAYVGVLVQNLRALPPGKRVYSEALEAAASSPHPAGVAFLLEALRDPSAPTAWRQAAFHHLAGTGGEPGVAAVRAARAARAPRPPWWERVGTLRDPHWKPRLTRDKQGRDWARFQDPVLGNGSDLFVVEKTGKGWGRPLFTGAWTSRTWHLPESKSVRGVPIAKVLRQDWVRLFPSDPHLRRDGDRDGLTDLVEARLGTDPRRADTDRDGLGDAVDPCPNAAPRRLGEDEQVIAAAVEARFFLEQWDTPAVISLPGIQPFETYGYPGTLVWEPGEPGPLGRHYGTGVVLVTCGAEQGRGPIQYSPDRKTAHLLLHRASGGRSGDGTEIRLRKIGSEWF